MADQPRRVRKPKKQKVKQGHKLVWLTLIIIIVPLAIVGYVLFTSAQGNDKPVEGSRYSRSDLNPAIDQASLDSIETELAGMDGVESATVNLNSATVRVHLNMYDELNTDNAKTVAENAYEIVNNYLPVDTYFTDTENGKNYDLEVDVYNYTVDDSHPADGQVYVKITKNGPGNKVVDVITSPKNAELAQSVKTVGSRVPQAPTEDLNGDGVVDENDTQDDADDSSDQQAQAQQQTTDQSQQQVTDDQTYDYNQGYTGYYDEYGNYYDYGQQQGYYDIYGNYYTYQ